MENGPINVFFHSAYPKHSKDEAAWESEIRSRNATRQATASISEAANPGVPIFFLGTDCLCPQEQR